MTSPGEAPDVAGVDVPDIDLPGLVDQLRARVARRRAEGDYPADVEERLARHFDRIRNHPVHENHLAPLRQAISELDGPSQFAPPAINLESKTRLGEQIHRIVAQVVARQVAEVVDQVQGYANAVRPVFELVAEQLVDLEGFVHLDLAGQVEAALDRLGRRELASDDVTGELSALRARVASLEADQRPRIPLDDRALHERFEGTRTEMVDRGRHLGELIGGRTPVIDLACGEGELLGVLAEAGTSAQGVDERAAMVAEARRQGLAASESDPLVALGRAPDASLGAVVMAEGVEHLSPQSLVDLVAIAATKLIPGGAVILAADNPAAVLSGASRAGSDPRRRGPLGPEYLTFVFGAAGFARCDLHWSATPTSPLPMAPGGDGNLGGLVGRLNELLFPPARFTLVAVRDDATGIRSDRAGV